jgi:hypothetical protein
MTQSEQEIIRSLGKIEGQMEGVENALKEIHTLNKRVAKLEDSRSRLYGALTIIGLLWTAAVAFLLKTLK